MMANWLRTREYRVLVFILLVTALHGLLYVFMVPPWQHYDEPTHFEYAWMIANKGELPVPEQFDWDFRADLVRSLIAHKFYWNLILPDPENLTGATPGLAYPQLDDPPLYYLWISLPVGLMKGADLASQLIVGRLFSLVLLLVSVVAAWGTLREMTPPGSPWRVFVPLTMALLPGYIDLMTAVNDDVGAVAVFSLFLWGCVRLIQGSPTVLNAAWVLVTALAAFYTKSTAIMAVPFAGVALVLGFLRGRWRRLAWGLVFGAGILGLLVLVYWREPANWYRSTTQRTPVRDVYPDAPLGQHVLRLESAYSNTPTWLPSVVQPLPADLAASLGNRTLTLGFWIWEQSGTREDGSLRIRSPEINIDQTSISQPIRVTGQPQFFAFSVETGEAPNRIWVAIEPHINTQIRAPVIFIDGLVLAEGTYPLDQPPVFTDQEGMQGTWGGLPFRNLLRNPSAEQVWPAFRVPVDNFIARLLPNNVRPSMLLYSILDLPASGEYYLFTADNLLKTFWAKFGWNHVPLPKSDIAYPFLSGLTFLGFAGALLYMIRKWRRLPLDVLVFFMMILVAVWGGTMARGVITIFVEHPFIPAARYGYPAIIPTILLLVAGWFGLAAYLFRWFRIPQYIWYSVYLSGFILFDAVALWGLVRFYEAIP